MSAIRNGIAMLLLGASCVPGSASAAEAQAPALEASYIPSLRIASTRITESRDSTGSGNLTLSLSINVEGGVFGSIRGIKVTRAVDDKGRSLSIGSATVTLPGGGSVPLAMGRTPAANVNASLRLQVPARDASSIKLIEGTVEVYAPSEAGGSLVRVPNILTRSGPIDHPVLARNDIEFHFFGNRAAYDQSVSLYPWIARGTPPDFSKEVGYLQRQATDIVRGFQLQTARGSPIQPQNSGLSAGDGPLTSLGVVRLLSPLPPDTQLVLFLDPPDAIKAIPFRVDDIPLP